MVSPGCLSGPNHRGKRRRYYAGGFSFESANETQGQWCAAAVRYCSALSCGGRLFGHARRQRRVPCRRYRSVGPHRKDSEEDREDRGPCPLRRQGRLRPRCTGQACRPGALSLGRAGDGEGESLFCEEAANLAGPRHEPGRIGGSEAGCDLCLRVLCAFRHRAPWKALA